MCTDGQYCLMYFENKLKLNFEVNRVWATNIVCTYLMLNFSSLV